MKKTGKPARVLARVQVLALSLALAAVLLSFAGCGGTGGSANDLGYAPVKAYPKDLTPYDENMYSNLRVSKLKPEEGYWENLLYTSYREEDEPRAEGIRYDAASNTLILTNYCDMQTKIAIENMGDDFTLRIEGSCVVCGIEVKRSSLRITGEGGTLMVAYIDRYTNEMTGDITLDIGKNDAIMLDSVNLIVKGSIRLDSELETAFCFLAPLRASDGIRLQKDYPYAHLVNAEGRQAVNFRFDLVP